MNILKKGSIYNKSGLISDSETISPHVVDLGIAWTWMYDAPFVRAVVDACEAAELSVLEITAETISDVTRRVMDGTLRFRWFFDRASDEDDAFQALASFCLTAHQSGLPGSTVFVNPSDKARRAADKATMHLEFITHGIHVPHTIILSPYADAPVVEISPQDIADLGKPFVIKPANTTGGGTGVITDATAVKDVARHRKMYTEDKYLIQEKVSPIYLSEARAWFRVFYAFGDTRLCWWDDETHIYDNVTSDEERWFELGSLRSSIETIAKICRLDFFSTEFAQRADGTYVSVDYVNELCDMRPKSTTPDGVPDSMIEWVAHNLSRSVASHKPKSK